MTSYELAAAVRQAIDRFTEQSLPAPLDGPMERAVVDIVAEFGAGLADAIEQAGP